MSREEFLSSIPSAPHLDPCRCLKTKGYGLIPERNMWVCGNCSKPSWGHPGYNPVCWGCDKQFTVKVYGEQSLDLCPDCE